MYGKDIERMLSEVETVKKTTLDCINDFASRTAYQLTHYGPHDAVLIPWSPPCYPIELEYPVGPIMPAIDAAMAPLYIDMGKMDALKGLVYCGSGSFNNSISSPWTELEELKKAVNNADIYHGIYVPFNYLGEKTGMLAHLNAIYTAVCDCKAPLMIFHNTIQQGWDHNFNGNSPSISWNDDLNGRKTIGLGTQTYGGQVGIPGKSKNPY